MERVEEREVREYTGVLVEMSELLGGFERQRVLLQTTDEEEYRVLEGRNLTRYLRRRVRIVGRLYLVEGERVLEVLDVSPVELNGSLD